MSLVSTVGKTLQQKNDDKDVKHAVSICQIIWLPWKDQLGNREDPSVLSEADAFNISNHLMESVTFTKNIGAPSGDFNFKLDNSRDWKSIMKPGQWCIISLTNEGDLSIPNEPKYDPDKPKESLPTASKSDIKKNRIRAICYIERVSVNVRVDIQTGVKDIDYEVSGRDFGVAYEETDLWFNYFKFEKTQVQSLISQINVDADFTIDNLISRSHDLFFAPQKVIKSRTKESVELGEVGTQWILPKNLFSLLDIPLDGDPFFGNIRDLKNFKPTSISIPIQNPLAYANGNAWERLKSFSAPELHELFPELDSEGKPKLNLRPIPWGIDSTGYPRVRSTVGEQLMYKNFIRAEGIQIENIDVADLSIGEENHNRYNHFLTTATPSIVAPESNISLLEGRSSDADRQFPNIQKGSIRRHGFRPMHVDVDTFAFSLEEKAADPKKGKPNSTLLLEYNELVFDYWNNAIFFETGSASIFGNNAIRVGKPIIFSKDVAYVANKAFYVEEYTDEFIVEENSVGTWYQTLQLTRGIELSNLDSLKGFEKRSEEFKHTGKFTGDN